MLQLYDSNQFIRIEGSPIEVMQQWRHPEFCFRGAKYTFANIGGANHGFAVIKSQILQVLKHPSPPCCDATEIP